MEDKEGNLWIATYTDNKGLIRFSPEGEIRDFTTEDGLSDNAIRSIIQMRDGSIVAGTNGGIDVLRNNKVVASYGAETGMKNPMILTVEEGNNGEIIAGSDGGGMYIIDNGQVSHIGLSDGLTSEVVMRVKKDPDRNLTWFITSNSIGY